MFRGHYFFHKIETIQTFRVLRTLKASNHIKFKVLFISKSVHEKPKMIQSNPPNPITIQENAVKFALMMNSNDKEIDKDKDNN